MNNHFGLDLQPNQTCLISYHMGLYCDQHIGRNELLITKNSKGFQLNLEETS